jgi:imidazolonepropionase
MATAGTVAMLLPAAFHFLRETTLPPIDLFREYGVPMAVASDCNPGTSPLLSVREAMALACTCFRITPEEALLGATRHAARALGWDDRGELHEGLRADLALWRVGHPSELSYWSGAGLLRRSWCGGKELKHLQDPP